MSADFLTFKAFPTTYRVKPENLEKVLALIEKAREPYKMKRQTCGPRRFPKFVPGETTAADYIRAYIALNHIGTFFEVEDLANGEYLCSHPAPFLDPAIPEVTVTLEGAE